MKKPNQSQNSLDALDITQLYFQDVAQLPILNGRAELVPLLRRVQRQVVIADVPLEKVCCQTIIDLTCVAVQKFDLSAVKFGNPPLDCAHLSAEIDAFFDTPNILTPVALARSLNGCNNYKDESQLKLSDAGWRCLYLLSLLPLALRTLPSFVEDTFTSEQYLVNALVDAADARRKLIEGTLRYIVTIAKYYIGQDIPYLDLVQEGFFGLSRAIETYKEYLGTHFQQHASTWIRQKIGRYVSENAFMIRLPTHHSEKTKEAQVRVEAFEAKTGTPITPELLEPYILDQISLEEQASDDLLTAKKRKKQRASLRAFHQYQMVTQPHLSWETGTLPDINRGGIRVPLDALVMDPISLEEYTDASWFRDEYKRLKHVVITERHKSMMDLRFGLMDGEARTLEEIGQTFGLSRERVRQIENDFLKKMRGRLKVQPEYLTSYERLDYVSESIQHRLQYGLAEDERQQASQFDKIREDNERQTIERLVNRYIERGRKGHVTKTIGISRTAILQLALKSLSRPAYYSEIYEQAQFSYGKTLPFTLKSAYSALFYDNTFHAMGKGVFALADHVLTVQADATSSECIFPYAPTPLLPVNASARAFFESLVVLRQAVLQSSHLTAEGLYAVISNWAKTSANDDPQAAFDAWYAAGMIEHIDFKRAARTQVLINPTAKLLKISELRNYCLTNLNRRILKMSELLHALDQIGQSTLSILRKVLYGNEAAGFDVSTRLELLSAFEAVRCVRDVWQLTELGRDFLTTLDPAELPDFGEIDLLDQPELIVDTQADMFDMFELD